MTRVEGNDTVWFSRFDWTNSDTAAKRVEVDVCWNEINGYTYAFLDSFPENRLYVTIGLRRKNNGAQMASMSVFRHRSDIQLENIQVLPAEGFEYYKGGEGDIYCMGNFPFNLDEYYRLIILALEDRVEGYIYQWSNREVSKIGTFLTGAGSRILARSSNGVALERVGMRDACETRSSILLRNPLRVDINDIRGGATRGMISYQRCPNVNVESDPEGRITLSHGGDTTKLTPSGWLRWHADDPISFDVSLHNCRKDLE